MIMGDERDAERHDDQVPGQRAYSKEEARRIVMELNEKEEQRQKNYTKADENRLQEEMESNSGEEEVYAKPSLKKYKPMAA
jgi:hypothetical protein